MSNLMDHAKRELEAAGFMSKDGFYGDMLGKAALELMEVFVKQGHSGMSAPAVAGVFGKLAMFEPLGPLTGEDDEWAEVASQNGPLYQNKRCSHVFKDNDGAYDIEGRVFREPSGACFTSRDSRVPVTFPYTPTREYVDVPEERE